MIVYYSTVSPYSAIGVFYTPVNPETEALMYSNPSPSDCIWMVPGTFADGDETSLVDPHYSGL